MLVPLVRIVPFSLLVVGLGFVIYLSIWLTLLLGLGMVTSDILVLSLCVAVYVLPGIILQTTHTPERLALAFCQFLIF